MRKGSRMMRHTMGRQTRADTPRCLFAADHAAWHFLCIAIVAGAVGCNGTTSGTRLFDAAGDIALPDGSAAVPDGAADVGVAPGTDASAESMGFDTGPDVAADTGVAPGTDASAESTGFDTGPDGNTLRDALATGDGLLTPTADTPSDPQTTGEWLDDGGVCRSNQLPSFRTCQPTFQDAVAVGAPVGTTVSGWCGDLLVWISRATPSLGCAYDSTGATLVARYFGDDVREHCDKTSYGVSTPGWPADCAPQPLDAGAAGG